MIMRWLLSKFKNSVYTITHSFITSTTNTTKLRCRKRRPSLERRVLWFHRVFNLTIHEVKRTVVSRPLPVSRWRTWNIMLSCEGRWAKSENVSRTLTKIATNNSPQKTAFVRIPRVNKSSFRGKRLTGTPSPRLPRRQRRSTKEE